MSATITATARPGRPTHLGRRSAGGAQARIQILEHAARLFTQHGFAGTSTRDIAEAAGIRQASLYYHFRNKGDLLEELLARTIRPTVQQIGEVEHLALQHGWPTALASLVLIDLHTLNSAPHNAGMLCKLPDVTNHEAFKQFRSMRSDLSAAYNRFAAGIDPSNAAVAGDTGATLLQLVEVAIQIRRLGGSMSSAACCSVATAALQLCRVSPMDIARTVGDATDLTARFRRRGGMHPQPMD